MAQNPNQPIYILAEDTIRTKGREAQRNNIMAAKLVAETVRTTLGPKGMDKMIVDSLNNITITNDGVTILEQMQVEHPAAKMLVEVSKTQENEIGDGTTTVVVIAGELLKNAESLLDKEVHPTVIAKGYRLAAEKAIDILAGMAENISYKDDALLKSIAITAMTGKGAESAKEHIASLIVQAIKQVSDNEFLDVSNIKIEKKTGDSIEESSLIKGLLLDKERIHPAMPKRVESAKIALINSALEVKNTEIDAKIEITDPSQMQAFLNQEEEMIKGMADKVIKSGANVLVCQKGIDDLAQHYLAKAGIYAIRRVTNTDMEKLSRATGANIITKLSDLTKEDLGYAGIVEEQKIGDDSLTYIQECKNPKAVTILIRGGSEHIVDEVERAVSDAIGDIKSAIRSGKVVAGGGATEMEVALQLKKYSNKLSGREQLAVLAFADSMEIIPRTLSENAGLDPIDMLTELKAKHEKGMKWAGIDAFSGKIVDCWKAKVIEPLKIKTQAIKSASEVAELILRIDDVIAGGKPKESMMPPQGGMPPGMM